jgi:quinone-modifying oxidoreductase subunit QmoC
MSTINPSFGKELKKYGAFDFNACYNCGNCTATCSLATIEDPFPREMVRYSSLGLEEEIKSSLKPWLCYYCGECSSQCPREANPGELMMSLRRWLTAKYDWTGLSGLLYKSLFISLLLFVLSALGVYLYSAHLNHQLDAVMHIGHYFEMIAIASVFVIILLPNLIRMWWYVEGQKQEKAPLKAYFSSLGELFVHMFTQKRALGCDNNQVRWFEHLILVFGYLLLLFTTVFLDWFVSKNIFITALGYLESVVVFIVTFDFMRRRMQREKEVSKYSQPSDWFFVIWLFLMGFTAFFVRLFIDLNILEQNVWLYLVHMVILVQWAALIVPFGKWTHFLYRSFAMYLDKVNKLSKKIAK